LNLILFAFKSLKRLPLNLNLRLTLLLNLWLAQIPVVLRDILVLDLCCLVGLGLTFFLHSEFHLFVFIHGWLLNILLLLKWLRLAWLPTHMNRDLRLNVLKPLHLPLLFITHLALFSDHSLHFILLLLHLFHVLSVVVLFKRYSRFRL